MWTIREQFAEFIKDGPTIGWWRCFYFCYLYRWHARLVHKFGLHTWQGLGVEGVAPDNSQGLAPYFERCSWCGKVKNNNVAR